MQQDRTWRAVLLVVLSGDGANLHTEAFMPWSRGLERGVDILNVANTFILQPIFKGLGAPGRLQPL
ncbi:MAG: hypothetical protein V4587_01460, partial [Acidobacteriota bacterium]